MKLFTIGFTQKKAEEFFESLKKNKIDILIDVRLNNKSQLAGFAKGDDLKYFLDKICRIKYSHEKDYTPTKELLSGWRNKTIEWNQYVEIFNSILNERRAGDTFLKKYFKEGENICFLCSEKEPEYCHRRLLAEYLVANCEELSNVEIVHIM